MRDDRTQFRCRQLPTRRLLDFERQLRRPFTRVAQLREASLGNANLLGNFGQGLGILTGQICIESGHAFRLAYLNETNQAKSLAKRNDTKERVRYPRRMRPRHDIYLAAWLKTLKKRQADLCRDLGWNKAKPSLIASGKQQYQRDDVNELAIYLHLEPYELLIHPDDAMALRRLRQDAIKIAAVSTLGEARSADPPERLREGTNG